MTTIKKLGKITFLALAISLGSCSSDSDGGSVNAGAGTITAKVDGATVTSIPSATFAFLTEGGLQITGSNINAQNLALTIVTFDGVGKYDIGGGTSIAVGTYSAIDISNPMNTNNIWFAPYSENAVDGVIDVTEQTETNVKGTFSFKAANESGNIKNVTNGSFNVPISDAPQ